MKKFMHLAAAYILYAPGWKNYKGYKFWSFDSSDRQLLPMEMKIKQDYVQDLFQKSQ